MTVFMMIDRSPPTRVEAARGGGATEWGMEGKIGGIGETFDELLLLQIVEER